MMEQRISLKTQNKRPMSRLMAIVFAKIIQLVSFRLITESKHWMHALLFAWVIRIARSSFTLQLNVCYTPKIVNATLRRDMVALRLRTWLVVLEDRHVSSHQRRSRTQKLLTQLFQDSMVFFILGELILNKLA